jgi:hypothetical protein
LEAVLHAAHMVKLDTTTQTVMAGRAFVQAAKALHTLYVPSNNLANPVFGLRRSEGGLRSTSYTETHGTLAQHT